MGRAFQTAVRAKTKPPVTNSGTRLTTLRKSNHSSIPEAMAGPIASNKGFTRGGDLIIRSLDGMKFSVHSVLLSLASPTLLGLIEATKRDGVALFSERAEILALMLKFIYPLPSPIIALVELFEEAILVADKYCLPSMKARLREQITLVDSPVSAYTNPLGALYIATIHGLTAEAELAAKIASKNYDFGKAEDLKKLIEAGPATTTLTKLVGIPAVKTRVLTEVLFQFEHLPMDINRILDTLVCVACRETYQGYTLQGAPEWVLRWARWIFDRIKDRPIKDWRSFFSHSNISMALYQPHLSTTFLTYRYHGQSHTCTCINVVLAKTLAYQTWANGVYEHLKRKLSVVEELEAQLYGVGAGTQNG
ncbi:hypothetical protein RHS03_09843, partial [Rhizoctonia solani]